MPIRDLRAKYGASLKGRAAVNAAIRAELVGGEDCLDALELLHRLTTRLRERNLPGADDAQNALNAARACANVMSDEIAERYGLGQSDA